MQVASGQCCEPGALARRRPESYEPRSSVSSKKDTQARDEMRHYKGRPGRHSEAARFA